MFSRTLPSLTQSMAHSQPGTSLSKHPLTPGPFKPDFLKMCLTNGAIGGPRNGAMDNPCPLLCSPLCIDMAEGIHKAGQQCGPKTQFSVDKAAKGEKKRYLRKSTGTLAQGRRKLGPWPTPYFSSCMRLNSFIEKFPLKGSLLYTLTSFSRCLNVWSGGGRSQGKEHIFNEPHCMPGRVLGAKEIIKCQHHSDAGRRHHHSINEES